MSLDTWPDLRLFSAGGTSALNAEQRRRPDSRASLPLLLDGEGRGFTRYVERLHAQAQRS